MDENLSKKIASNDIHQPALNLGEDISPSSLHAPLPIPTEMSSISGVIHPPEKIEICIFLIGGYCI